MKDSKLFLESIRILAAGSQPNLGDSELASFSQLLFHHGCFYLLSLIEQTHPYTPQLKIRALLNRNSVDERYKNCQPVFQELETIGIPYAVIKGAVLSIAAFGSPYSRCSGDIDLLVNRCDVDIVKQIMLNHGFTQGRATKEGVKPFTRSELLFQATLSHQTAPFVRATGNKFCPFTEVDINMDIFWGERLQKTNMDFVLAQTTKGNVCGTTIKKLSPEMELISLCLHHYKDMNSIYLLSHNSLTLKLFCDIYFYFKNENIKPEKLYALCKQLGASEYVYYCLYYTDYIFNNPLLKEHCHALYSPKAQRLLNTFGLGNNEIQEWEISFLERLLYTDIHTYFQNTLSPNLLRKIETNEQYM